MKKLIQTSVLSMFLLFIGVFAQAQSAQDPLDVKRMFIYHFIKHIDWPQTADNIFVMTVIGDKEVYDKMKFAFSGKDNRTGREYVVKYADNIQDLEDSELVFLSKSSSKYADDLVASFDKKPILLITDKLGLGKKGSGINFKEIGNTLRFELNLEALQKAGLRVSGQLKNLAILL